MPPIYLVSDLAQWIMASDQYQQYHSQAVTQADPVKLVEMLFEGAIKFTNRAKKAISDGDMELAHHNILRAYAIISELMATLDFEQGGEVAVGLEQLYEYVLHLYREANIKKEEKYLDDALRMIEPLLASWSEAFKNGLPADDSNESTSAMTGVARNDTDGSSDTVENDSQHVQPTKHKPLDLTG